MCVASVVCCRVEVSASDRSPAQWILADCVVSDFDREEGRL
jgi:hypothetical protein